MRLLLVEDDVMVASGIKLGLSNAGYAVDWRSEEHTSELQSVKNFAKVSTVLRRSSFVLHRSSIFNG